MTRVNVYGTAGFNEYGSPERTLAGHFDWSKAARWSDADDYNGDGSGGPGRGTAVMLTAGGKWVLETWTHWQGEANTYEYIAEDEARDWLLRNHEDGAVAEHFGEIAEEEDRRPGRPEIGGAVHVRLGEMIEGVDNYARMYEMTRADALRKLVGDGLTHAYNCGH